MTNTLTLFACVLVAIGAAQSSTQSIRLSISEEMPAETIVGMLSSHKTVLQLAATHKQKLNFTLPKANAFFTIDEASGMIRSRVRLDREALCNEISTCCQPTAAGQPDCTIPLQVLVNPLKEFLQVDVLVVDVNDHAPSFAQSPMTTFVPENEAPGRFCIDLPLASDPDSAALSVKDYRLDPVSSTFRLRMNARPATRYSDLCLLVLESLDREKVQSYSLRVIAVDGGSPARTGTLSLTVRVLDTNDNRPTFDNASYAISIPEHTAVNTPVTRVHATDADEGEHGAIVYSFLSQNGEVRESAGSFQPASTDRVGPFFIQSETGQIILENPLDYEDTRLYHLRVLARDSSAQPRFSTQSVMIQVTNVNDCAPEIEILPIRLTNDASDSHSELQVFENEPSGTTIGMVTVSDRDERTPQAPRCSLSSSHFRLAAFDGESNKFKIITRFAFDREDIPRFEVIMRCEDSGLPSLTSETSFTVSVLDRDDNTPRFASNETTIHVRENNEINQLLGSLNVLDADAAISPVRFELRLLDAEAGDKSLITVVNETGEVLANVAFDREQRDSYRFVVRMIRVAEPAAISSTLLTLIIDDANDEAPRFEQSHYKFEVAENSEVQTFVGRVRARDEDTSRNIRYTLAQPNAKFSLTENGELFTMGSLDREVAADYSFQVLAHDDGTPELSSTALVQVSVLDQNDNKPVFLWPNAENHTINVSIQVLPSVIAHVEATDADAKDNSRISYFMQKRAESDSLFEIEESTGNLFLKRLLTEADKRLYKLVIEAVDSGKPAQREMAVLNVVITDRMQLQVNLQQEAETDNSASRLVIAACAGLTTVTLALLVISVVYMCMRRSRAQREDVEKHADGRFVRSPSSDYEVAMSNDTESESAGSARTTPISGLLAHSSSRSFDRVPIGSRMGEKTYSFDDDYEQRTMRTSSSTRNFKNVPNRSMMPDFYSSSESFASKRSMSDECLSSINIHSKYGKVGEKTFCVGRPHVIDFIPIASHSNGPTGDYSSLSDENGSETQGSVYSKLSDPKLPQSVNYRITENPTFRHATPANTRVFSYHRSHDPNAV